MGHESPFLEDNMGNNFLDISKDGQDESLHVDSYQLLGYQMVAKGHSIDGYKNRCLYERVKFINE